MEGAHRTGLNALFAVQKEARFAGITFLWIKRVTAGCTIYSTIEANMRAFHKSSRTLINTLAFKRNSMERIFLIARYTSVRLRTTTSFTGRITGETLLILEMVINNSSVYICTIRTSGKTETSV